MLPPVLEVYVVWHPGDAEGEAIADLLMEHFRGTAFSGLIGGAVEVYVRSVSASDDQADAPRQLPCTSPLPYGLLPPALTAIVLVAGQSLALEVQRGGNWREYVTSIAEARAGAPDHVGLFTVPIHDQALDGTILAELVGGVQAIANGQYGAEDFASTLTRDLAQAITQMSSYGPERVTVFVSHTKRLSPIESEDESALLDLIREVIVDTRLREFFDAHDLQPNTEWAAELRKAASTGALLAVRTDLYSSRPWCQDEVLTAKNAGMPVVILDALTSGEERGSFVMDHVPRTPGRQDANHNWNRGDIVRALGQVVDGCLKRVLWRTQEVEATAQGLAVQVDWWAPHAPEPTTLADWLERQGLDTLRDRALVVLHPDPPLGPSEIAVLQQLARLANLRQGTEFLTPRGLAARGG